MIPAIGYMIGFYILTKMAVILGRKDIRVECGGARTMAIITIIIAIVMMFLILEADMDTSSVVRKIQEMF